jgi:multimeric flavodoxin WrbA
MAGDGRPMQVVGFAGSPRAGGNSESLLDEVLRGASEAGATTEKIRLAALRIEPCLACDACRKTGICVQTDDMADLVERMMASDIWVLAAQLKLFIDRWYAPWHDPDARQRFAGKRAILVASMGDSNPKTARHVVGMLADAFDYLDMRLAATLLAPSMNDRRDASGSASLLAKAFETGRTAITGI